MNGLPPAPPRLGCFQMLAVSPSPLLRTSKPLTPTTSSVLLSFRLFINVSCVSTAPNNVPVLIVMCGPLLSHHESSLTQPVVCTGNGKVEVTATPPPPPPPAAPPPLPACAGM